MIKGSNGVFVRRSRRYKRSILNVMTECGRESRSDMYRSKN